MNQIRHHGRELLDQARRERTPDAADRERVFGALMASAALATASTATAAPAVGEKVLTGLSKWLLLAGLASTVTAGVYLAGHVGAKASAIVAVAAPPIAAQPAPQLDVTPAAGEALPVPPNQPDATLAPLAPRASVTRRDADAPSLEAELAGLQAAHAAYRSGNAARTLALLAEHKARFPKSQLSTERATLEVLALCRVGRSGDARMLADRLRKSAGNAAALSGLDGSCASK